MYTNCRQCTLTVGNVQCTVQCTLQAMYSVLYSVHCRQCTLTAGNVQCIVQCTLQAMYSVLYSVHCRQCTLTAGNVQCIVQCTLQGNVQCLKADDSHNPDPEEDNGIQHLPLYSTAYLTVQYSTVLYNTVQLFAQLDNRTVYSAVWYISVPTHVIISRVITLVVFSHCSSMVKTSSSPYGGQLGKMQVKGYLV